MYSLASLHACRGRVRVVQSGAQKPARAPPACTLPKLCESQFTTRTPPLPRSLWLLLIKPVITFKLMVEA